jgi:Toastrack DUF4097
MQNRLGLFLVLIFISSSLFAATEERTIHQTFALNASGRIDVSNVNVEIVTNSTPQRFSAETKYPRFKNNTDVSVRYEFMVPKSAILDEINNVNGEISITGVENEIRISTVNGAAEVQGTKSSLSAETVNGRIEVAWIDFPRNGNVDMQTVNGSLKLRLPGNANADVHAASLNGSIESEFPMTVQGRFISKKLTGKIGAGGTSIDLNTVNGSINILKSP